MKFSIPSFYTVAWMDFLLLQVPSEYVFETYPVAYSSNEPPVVCIPNRLLVVMISSKT